MKKILVQTAVAAAIVGAIAATGAASVSAQGYLDAIVTAGGTTHEVTVGDVTVVVPGLTIDAGAVSNVTGIGVDAEGGTGGGSASGGSTNVTVGQ